MFTKAINTRWRAATAGLLAVIAVSLINITAPMQGLELMASDFAVYHRNLPRPTGTVIIAAIDEQSIAEFGRWPWRRSMEARPRRCAQGLPGRCNRFRHGVQRERVAE
jgi:CHASE2 domain-containing sensor protein